jgi:hypothetical protein
LKSVAVLVSPSSGWVVLAVRAAAWVVQFGGLAVSQIVAVAAGVVSWSGRFRAS